MVSSPHKRSKMFTLFILGRSRVSNTKTNCNCTSLSCSFFLFGFYAKPSYIKSVYYGLDHDNIYYPIYITILNMISGVTYCLDLHNAIFCYH